MERFPRTMSGTCAVTLTRSYSCPASQRFAWTEARLSNSQTGMRTRSAEACRVAQSNRFKCTISKPGRRQNDSILPASRRQLQRGQAYCSSSESVVEKYARRQSCTSTARRWLDAMVMGTDNTFCETSRVRKYLHLEQVPVVSEKVRYSVLSIAEMKVRPSAVGMLCDRFAR